MMIWTLVSLVAHRAAQHASISLLKYSSYWGQRQHISVANLQGIYLRTNYTKIKLRELANIDLTIEMAEDKFPVLRAIISFQLQTYFAFRGPALRNILPDQFKFSASKEIFKINIKNERTMNRILLNKGTVFNKNKKKDYINY